MSKFTIASLCTKPKLDISGMVFGRITAKNFLGRQNGGAVWMCQCSCGNTKPVTAANLVKGNVQSCGCLRREVLKHVTHGLTKSPEYRSWQAMKARCKNPRTTGYGNYGGRGISFAERWEKFENFLFDMGPRPSRTSLDRIDNNGNYEPGNCRWATTKEQGNNKRTCQMISFNGITATVSEWASQLGIPQPTLSWRIHRGIPIEKALIPAKNRVCR